jgi:2-phosphosulfolactate phosphatase
LYTQHPYRCRFDWGRHGVLQAALRGDILVIVDTLSFSTATVTAVHSGGSIYPCTLEEGAAALAQRIGGEAAVSRYDVPHKGRFSLSPATYLHLEPGTRVVLDSPNGATCSRYASQVPFLFVGALVNAKAVATVVSSLLEQKDLSVTVIACGERWKTPSEDGELRVALEDYLELEPSCPLCHRRNHRNLVHAKGHLSRFEMTCTPCSGSAEVVENSVRKASVSMSSMLHA